MRPRVRTAALTGFVGLARSLGLDPAALLHEAGLDLGDLAVPDRWVLAARVARLLERSAEQSSCPDFGLRLAALRPLGALGPLSVVLRDEPDLRSAVQLLVRHERAYNEALHLRLREAGELASIEVWLEFEEPVPSTQSIDLVMGALVGIVRALVGDGWQPLTPTFARPAPADVAPYRSVFGLGLRFGGDFTGLVLPSRDLDVPVVIADPSLRRYTHEFLRAIVDTAAPTAAGQVGEVVEVLLPLGRCSLTDVAQYLGARPRALQRLLAGEGTRFSAIVHATRAREAERYLAAERYSLTEVAMLLGFDAPSAFSRWFRQHFGVTAADWRRTALAAPDRSRDTTLPTVPGG
ncbi:AraC family transcriptional regulator [Blastococcus litoris]|uniref:AraC family transcriptional regulator n=1 Tax=Blastococcus litoris TaxID=2171622 RepID=UPI000E301877|nr:AraC family transcriptional regulator [Blastococcus litoris]